MRLRAAWAGALIAFAAAARADVSPAGLSLRGPIVVKPNGVLVITGKSFTADRSAYALGFARRCIAHAVERRPAHPVEIRFEYSADRILTRDLLDSVRSARGAEVIHDRVTIGDSSVLDCGPIRITVAMRNADGWFSTDHYRLLYREIRDRRRSARRMNPSPGEAAIADWEARLDAWMAELRKLMQAAAKEK